MQNKVCRKCGVEKGVDEFYMRQGGRRVHSECRVCFIAANKKYRKKHAEAYKAYQETYRAKHRDALNSKERIKRLMRVYGVDLIWVERQLVRQNGKCAICGFTFLFDGKPINQPNIDHDHETGSIRGLLCHKCNKALGLFSDNPDLLFSAFKYLTVN